MKGTVKITIDGGNIAVEVRTSQMEPFERMVVVDSVVRALRITPNERTAIGLAIAAGGMDVLAEGRVDETIIDLSALKKQKGKQNDKPEGKT